LRVHLRRGDGYAVLDDEWYFLHVGTMPGQQ